MQEDLGTKARVEEPPGSGARTTVALTVALIVNLISKREMDSGR